MFIFHLHLYNAHQFKGLNYIHVYNGSDQIGTVTRNGPIRNSECWTNIVCLEKRLNKFSYLISGVARWGSLEPGLFWVQIISFSLGYFRKMRPSFKRLFAVTLLIIFQVGRYSIYFSLIYLKDIKRFFLMPKIIIKTFLQNVVKKSFFYLVGGILRESVVWQQTNIVLRMAWVKIIKLIPPIHLNPFPEETLCLLVKVISRQHWYAKKLTLKVPITTKFVLSSAECWNVQ